MRIMARLGMLIVAGTLWMQDAAGAQEMQMPKQEHTMRGGMSDIKAEYPRLGRAQERGHGQLVTLEQAQKIASESNPTLRQAEAEIRATKARQQQAGLYPNPTVGYTGDEIRGGAGGSGKQGFFVQQTIVTGGKLGLSREVFGKEVKLAELEAEEQKIRVQSAVKIAFLRVLAAQELLDARRDMAKIAQDAAETDRRLMNTGQADESEVLEAEVEAQRMRMSARMQENTLREEWRSLAAVIGQPEMPMATVAGDLEKDWPELNEEQVVEAISKESPAVRIAEAAEGRAQSVLMQARRGAIPDVQWRGGLEYNHETLGSVPYAKGWEGIAEVAVEIPFFNRNQGNVAAARADIERAGQEKKRIALTLRERAASAVDQYANARLMATEYREEMLAREESVWIDGGQIRADAGFAPARPRCAAETFRIADRIYRGAGKRLDQRPRAARLSADGRAGSSRAARRSGPAGARNQRADAGTNDVAPRTRTQPVGMVQARARSSAPVSSAKH